jgi:protein-tyrosine phosphatase
LAHFAVKAFHRRDRKRSQEKDTKESPYVIDIHCHILPEVDDGPKSWEIAEGMCRIAAKDGISHMVATPHANDRYFYDRAYLLSLLEQLQQRVGPTPQLSLGCDFHLSYENTQAAMQNPERWCIADTRYLLVEFNNFSIPPQLDDWLASMCERGNVPIITHPERNPILQKVPERVLQWVSFGCAVQITASALTGSWGETSGKMARFFLKKGAVHFLATDSHDTVRRPPILSQGRKVVEKEFGADLAFALVEGNPAAVLSNKPLVG